MKLGGQLAFSVLAAVLLLSLYCTNNQRQYLLSTARSTRKCICSEFEQQDDDNDDSTVVVAQLVVVVVIEVFLSCSAWWFLAPYNTAEKKRSITSKGKTNSVCGVGNLIIRRCSSSIIKEGEEHSRFSRRLVRFLSHIDGTTNNTNNSRRRSKNRHCLNSKSFFFSNHGKNPFPATVRRKNDLPQARQRKRDGDLYCQKRSLLDVTQKKDPQMMHVVQHQPSHRRGGNTERTLSCYCILLLLHN